MICYISFVLPVISPKRWSDVQKFRVRAKLIEWNTGITTLRKMNAECRAVRCMRVDMRTNLDRMQKQTVDTASMLQCMLACVLFISYIILLAGMRQCLRHASLHACMRVHCE